MSRKNILLLSMAISSTKGSEYSVAWNHIKFMSKYHNFHVIYATSSDTFGDTSSLQDYLNNNPINNVVFHAVKPSILSNKIFNLRVWLKNSYYARYLLYTSFKLWHKEAYKFAKVLVKSNHFDLVHFLGPIGYREPGYLWKLGLPYIRGPVGGTYQKPKVLFKALSAKEKIIFYIRNLINWWQFNYSLQLIKSLRKTDILLTTSTRVQSDFFKRHKKESICLPENSIYKIHGLNTKKFLNFENLIKIIWVGRIDGNKALIILLQALNRISERNFCLTVAGKDSNRSKFVKQFVQKNKLNKYVHFLGAVPRQEVFNLMNQSHLQVISSISEGHPTIQWEAMSVGLPTLTLDHCGMGDIINNQSGRKIPITTYEGTIGTMADALSDFLKNPQKLKELAYKTIVEAEKHTWERRVDFFNELYSKF